MIDCPHPVLDGISAGDHACIMHSLQFRVANPAHLLAHTDYCGPITAIVGARTVVGTRFHPEKAKRRGCS